MRVIHSLMWVCLLSAVSWGQTAGRDFAADWFALAEQPATRAAAPQPAAEPSEGPPLPFHSVEGYGGACITPMAYLVNPGKKGEIFGLPAVSVTFLWAGHKNVQSFVVTETLWQRLELGYAASRFDTGSLPQAVQKATGLEMAYDELVLHNWNARLLLIEENSFGIPMPAIVAGVHVKYNDAVRAIDKSLGGALSGLGFARSNGIDYTLTASKTVPIGRPFIFTAGLRNSQAAQIGYLGFADHAATTFEGSVVCLVTDCLAVGYEFRQKENPYDKIDGLVGDEDNWHAINVGYILAPHMTICAGYAQLGNLANSSGNGAWALQVKFEF